MNIFTNRSVRVVSIFVLAFFISVRAAHAATYYVSPSGSSSAAGSINAPWNLAKLGSVILAPGDVVYLRGGTYRSIGSNPANTWTHMYIHDQHGTSSSPITIQAYPGEKPILDLSNFTTTISDPTAVKIENTSYLKLKGLRITGLKQVPSGAGVSRGLELYESDNNIIEQVEVDHIGGYGFITTNSDNNLFLNDDAHHLDDRYTTDGGAWGNANGFQSTGEGNTSTGNTYDGCRAWAISDDGFDFYGTDGFATIKNSWSFWNGYTPSLTDNSITFTPTGDGDGFKLGPDSSRYTGTSLYHNIVRRLVYNNIAFENAQHGFNQNAGDLRMQLYNNTAYKNGQKGYMWGLVSNQPADDFKNNISYANGTAYNGSAIIGSKNTWSTDLASQITLNAQDFQSISSVGADGPRNADGSLPTLSFLKLTSGSDLIDKGIIITAPVTIAYSGTLPDIGAYEYTTTTPPADTTAPLVTFTSPTNGATVFGTAVTLTAQASDNSGVTRVDFYQGQTLISSDTTSPYSTTWNSTTAPNGTTTLSAKAYDAAGNVGTTSVSVGVNNGDTVGPTTPTNIVTSNITDRSITVSWSTSTDNIAFAGYKLYRDGILIGITPANFYVDTGLLANSSHTYYVVAYDVTGNVSAHSPNTSATTSVSSTASDTIPPSAPIPVLPTTTNSNNYIAFTNKESLTLWWPSSTDASGIAGYKIYSNGQLIASTPENFFTTSKLAMSTYYPYYVYAYDKFGNSSAMSPDTKVFGAYTSNAGQVLFGPITIGSVVGGGNAVSGQTALGMYVKNGRITQASFDIVGASGKIHIGNGVVSPGDALNPNRLLTFTWDTTAVPNGLYYVAVTTSGGGIVETSTPVPVTVANQSVQTSGLAVGSVIKTTTTVNVRNSAGTSGQKLGTQNINKQGTIVGGPTMVNNVNWWNVNFDTGVDGWVIETYLSLVSNGARIGGNTTITAIDTLNLLNESSASSPAGNVQQGTTATKESVSVIASVLNVRSLPSTTSDILGKVVFGQTGKVINQTMIAGDTWYYVSFDGGITGWVSGTYVR